mgnify:CR=1 FL=1
MPKYIYKCNECNETFQVWHGMKEMQESCQLCKKENCLTRIPQFYSKPKTAESSKLGSITKDFINQNKELLDEMKKEARSQVYED